MSNEEQIELLRYQIKLLKMVVGGDDFPFFMYLLDHDISEKQARILRTILNILNLRYKNESLEPESQLIEIPEALKEKIPLDKLFSNEPPTYEEFETYVKNFLPDGVKAKYLLMSLKAQNIYYELTSSLLSSLKENPSN